MRAPDFWSGGGSAAGRFLACVLSPFGAVYGAITSARAERTDGWQAPVPVICVGNVVMGGAGKTQVCIDLAGRLAAHGHAPYILSRGYGGKLDGPVRVDPDVHTASDVGDEALLLGAQAPTWIGADRQKSARAACDAGAEILIMDDGFQNPSLEKTVSLVVIDGAYGFGNGRVCPAGPLRERVDRALSRADGVCVIGAADTSRMTLPAATPRFNALIAPTPDAPEVSGKAVVAFAGIGHPEKFFQTLSMAGADVVSAQAFADHHPYTEGDLTPLLDEAGNRHAMLVTTAKDHVRVPDALRGRVMPFPVQLDWEDAAAFERFVLDRAGVK